MTIEKKSAGDAVYKQIEVSLHQQIAAGQWPVGAMLPSRRALAKRYGVSSLTIERAISPLIDKGLLRADDRRGTFVAASAVVRPPRAASRPAAGLTIGIVGSLYLSLSHQEHLYLNNFWVRQFIISLEQTAADQEQVSRFFNRVREPGQSVASLRETIGTAKTAGADALAVIAFGVSLPELEEALEDHGLPIVCVTSQAIGRPVPHVFYDNFSAGYQAAQHLLRSGYHDLLFFAPRTAPWARERIAGARAAVAHAGLPPETLSLSPDTDRPWVQEEDPQALGHEAARDLLAARTSLPSGVIGLNDGMAFGFLEAAQEAGLAAGRDYGIVGFDDHPQSRVLQLTSLRPPMETMGREASRLLRQVLEGDQPGRQVCLDWHLIPRASTCRPATDAFDG